MPWPAHPVSNEWQQTEASLLAADGIMHSKDIVSMHGDASQYGR